MCMVTKQWIFEQICNADGVQEHLRHDAEFDTRLYPVTDDKHPLTKAMKSDRLQQTLKTGLFDIKPTAESLMIKEKNRACLKAAKTKGKNQGSIPNDDAE